MAVFKERKCIMKTSHVFFIAAPLWAIAGHAIGSLICIILAVLFNLLEAN